MLFDFISSFCRFFLFYASLIHLKIERTPTELVSPKEVRKVIFCSGKIYYELVAERAKRNLRDVAIVTVEQLSPFPYEEVLAECQRYENVFLSNLWGLD